MRASGDERILPLAAVPIEEAIREGQRAALHPHEGLFWRWRRDLYGRPIFGVITRVTVATPYYEIVRAAYARSDVAGRFTAADARALLAARVRESGTAFPIRLLLNVEGSAAASAARAWRILDARGRAPRAAPITFVARDVATTTFEGRGADLRGLWLAEIRGARRRVYLSLAGMR